MVRYPVFPKTFTLLFSILIVFGLLMGRHAHSAFYYKDYVIRQDRGEDILCDPYIVRKNDYVLKLFRQKGEIAQADFPEFLRIFKRINPHIHDINQIRPGQHIHIPLKKLTAGALTGQETGIVTIPFVTLENRKETISSPPMAYRVRQGDCVSILVSRTFAPYGSPSFQEGIALFKLLNPEVENIDRIYVGQQLIIPVSSMQDHPWVQSVLDGATTGTPPGTRTKTPVKPRSPLQEAAAALGGELLDKGTYYFPQSGTEDLAINLSHFPVMKFQDETILFTSGSRTLTTAQQGAVQNYWKNLRVVPMPKKPATEKLIDSVLASRNPSEKSFRLAFQDAGVMVDICAQWMSPPPEKPAAEGRTCLTLIDDWSEKTPEAIERYLARRRIMIKEVHRTGAEYRPETAQASQVIKKIPVIESSDGKKFVEKFLSAIGCRYTPGTGIIFPYAGIQVHAVSNLIKAENGRELLIDYGDLYGDAIQSIKDTGLAIIQLKEPISPVDTVFTLLDALHIPYEKNPVFQAAKRSGPFNTTLTLSGYLVKKGRSGGVLFTSLSIEDRIVEFLSGRDIRVIRMTSG